MSTIKRVLIALTLAVASSLNIYAEEPSSIKIGDARYSLIYGEPYKRSSEITRQSSPIYSLTSDYRKKREFDELRGKYGFFESLSSNLEREFLKDIEKNRVPIGVEWFTSLDQKFPYRIDNREFLPEYETTKNWAESNFRSALKNTLYGIIKGKSPKEKQKRDFISLNPKLRVNGNLGFGSIGTKLRVPLSRKVFFGLGADLEKFSTEIEEYHLGLEYLDNVGRVNTRMDLGIKGDRNNSTFGIVIRNSF